MGQSNASHPGPVPDDSPSSGQADTEWAEYMAWLDRAGGDSEPDGVVDREAWTSGVDHRGWTAGADQGAWTAGVDHGGWGAEPEEPGPTLFAQDGVADVLPPVAFLAALTEQATDDLGRLSDNELIGVLRATCRQITREQYKQVLVIAEFGRRRQAAFVDAARRGIPLGCRPGGFPGEELAIELVTTRADAGHRIDDAIDLTARLPRTLAGMAAGQIDLDRAGWIALYTRSLGPDDVAHADEILAESAPDLRVEQLARKAAALEMKLNPEAVKARKEHAKRNDQRVEARRETSGNASLAGRELDTADVMASKAHIDSIAAKLRRSGLIEGTLDHLRALAMTDLTQGRNPLDRITPNPASAGPASAGPVPAGPVPAGPAPAGAASAGPASAGPASAGPASAGPAPAGAASAGPASAGPVPAGPASAGPVPAGAASAGPASAGPVPAGPVPAGPVPAGPVPAGPVPAGAASAGPVSAGPVSAGPVSAGPVSAGPVSAGPVPAGPVPAGPGPAGLASAGPGSAGPAPVPFPALINILVPAGTLLGWSAAPAEAGSWGLLDAEEARVVASAASAHPRTRWCVTLTGADDTALGHGCAPGQHPRLLDDLAAQPPPDRLAELLLRLGLNFTPIAQGSCDHAHAEGRYAPSRALRHLVRARSATCDAPGCQSPAANADLDHTVSWPDGPTDQCNLAPRCRTHHRAKQAPDWTVEQPTPGVIRWTLPSGRTHVTTPTRYDTQ
jgi:hypothetical protein